jgi:hypothetical protein
MTKLKDAGIFAASETSKADSNSNDDKNTQKENRRKQ